MTDLKYGDILRWRDNMSVPVNDRFMVISVEHKFDEDRVTIVAVKASSGDVQPGYIGNWGRRLFERVK